MTAPASEFDDDPGLLIIRRRAHADHAEVKGGVWKIAYADFMTAMMAFFLVMWLINATNEETRQAVASYFNPVKLSSINTKGLEDPTVKDEAASAGAPEAEHEPPETQGQAQPASPAEAAPPAAPASPPLYGEEALFRDPYGVLAEIAGDGSAGAGEAAGAGGSGAAAGFVERAQSGDGDAYRDPFSPEFWQAGAEHSATAETSAPAQTGTIAAGEDVADAPKSPGAETAVEQIGDVATVEESAAPTGETAALPAMLVPPADTARAAAQAAEIGPGEVPSLVATGGAPPHAAGSAVPIEEAEALITAAPATELMEEIAAALGKEPGETPQIAAESTDEGMLISLTDDVSFGMFAIGSAEPQAETVHVMEKLAAVLAEHAGRIVIRGHTDARPFKTGPYDNWRLSTDRAHMAYYMLVRGGLDAGRVDRIEGYADRRLKLPDAPEADENRRIEILIRDGGA